MADESNPGSDDPNMQDKTDPEQRVDGLEDAEGDEKTVVEPVDWQAGWEQMDADSGIESTPNTAAKAAEKEAANVRPRLAPRIEDDPQTLKLIGDDGTLMLLKPGLNRLGRSAQSDLRIEDDSISRDHAKLLCNGRDVQVIDLGSANGTLVNDVPVSKAILQIGDIVKFGDVVFGFGQRPTSLVDVVVPNDTPSKASALSWLNKSTTQAAASCVLALAIFVAASVWVLGQVSDQSQAQQDKAFQVFEQGVKEFHSYHWQKAAAFFSQAMALEPTVQRYQLYQQAIGREQQAQKWLTQADKYYGQGDIVSAYELSEQVGDSIFFAASAAQLQEQIDVAVKARLSRAQTSWRLGQHRVARSLLRSVQGMGGSDNSEIKALAKQMGVTLDAPQAGSVVRFERTIDTVRHLFRQGQMNQAIAKIKTLTGSQAGRFLAQLQNFQVGYAQAMQAMSTNQTAKALKLWQQLLPIDQELSGGIASVWSTQIHSSLVQLLVAKGSQAVSQQQWVTAWQTAQEVLQLQPKQSDALQISQAVKSKSQMLLKQCQQLAKQADKQAVDMCTLVTQITAASSSANKQAQAVLQAMTKK